MRTTITVPDEFYKEIKVKLDAFGFTSFNDFMLDLARHWNQNPTMHQIDASDGTNLHQIDDLSKLPVRFCQSPHCGGQSYGKYLVTEEGYPDAQMWLCERHGAPYELIRLLK